jgi:hypothetical protein
MALVGGAAHDVRVRALEEVERLVVVARAAGLVEQLEAEPVVLGALVGQKAVQRVVEHQRDQRSHNQSSLGSRRLFCRRRLRLELIGAWSGTVAAVISLRPIDDSNRAQVEALGVSPIQERFVAGVADSLVEAVEDPGGRAIHWAIYAEDIPVGFVMISDEVDGPGYIAVSLEAPDRPALPGTGIRRRGA